MAPSVLLFGNRKAGLSPEEFKDYFENKHMALVKQQAGEHFPASHTRRYIARNAVDAPAPEASERNKTTPAVVFFGSQADFDYDVVTELAFRDEDHFKKFSEVFMEPAAAQIRADDEKNLFEDGSLKLVLLGDVRVTKA